jgi:hypothetical protein
VLALVPEKYCIMEVLSVVVVPIGLMWTCSSLDSFNLISLWAPCD